MKDTKSAQRLKNFFDASTDLMKVMARACGHERLIDFNQDDLITFSRDMADLSAVAYAGVGR